MIRAKLERIYSKERVINNLFANLIGLQVFRYVGSHLIYYIKLIKNFKSFDRNLKKLVKIGYFKEEDILDEKTFELAKSEFEKLINSKHSKNLQNRAIINYSVNLGDEVLEEYPNLKKIYYNKKIKNYFSQAEMKKDVDVKIRLERLIIKNNNMPDTNKVYHTDTFHNTYKAWIYLTDSNSENGPLIIKEKSHRFSFRNIIKNYIESIKYSIYVNWILKPDDEPINNYADNNYQFFRNFTPKKDLDKITTRLESKKNTLVFANTHAVHRRGDGNINSVRDSIHFYSRENPFKK